MINIYKSNAYYFLTDKLYGDLNEIHRDSKKDYFKLLTSEYRWFSFYAVDWVAQINFFHHYINNRVIFVTGSTGQGKTTQVPKLFLYALKMIDKKSNGRVICSQPRTDPTIVNSEQISWELGVPISEMSINYKKKIKTYNSYIQYQSQAASHQVESHNGLLLKLVTDKLLSMELFRSPIFKQIEKPYDDSISSESIEFNIYSKDNIYDIIIVDESHEHNINMDIILTIARDTI
jgi:Cdc6-like AAA superfamily ATPase